MTDAKPRTITARHHRGKQWVVNIPFEFVVNWMQPYAIGIKEATA